MNQLTPCRRRGLFIHSLILINPKQMDRYQKVEKPRAEKPIDENEIRITSQGRTRNYITYAMGLLQDKGSSEIVFKAMGRAINKTVTIVELIKRRIVGLHQITSIGSTDITDTWEPLEEGLLPLETTRHVSMIVVTLSKKELNTSSIGYQPPLPADQVKVETEFEYDGEVSPTARGRGRGGRGRGRGRSRTMPAESEDAGWDAPPDFPRGRGRGRGRNFRGRGRGSFNNNGGGRGSYNNNGAYVDDQYIGGYTEEAPTQQGRGEYEDAPRDFTRGKGRGRGRSYRGRGRGSYDNNGGYVNDQYDWGYIQEAPMQQGRGEYEDAGWDAPRDFTRGRGRGGGRNFSGRGRGSYSNNGSYADDQYGGGYNQEAPMQQGRGRGRGGRGRGRGFRSNGPYQAAAGGGM
ncbi:hypothetical protein QVD17_06867 [Tagetes erecta]|uniref:DNA/RNA-binding protein Alba-like domain-containing protein n=1 Tax=Tagetes erecta TaxID=13708 RepID=A0AAD8PCJ3_TARER|nr:hypothetical protein QVD17_06867 [Tagetes erecta]